MIKLNRTTAAQIMAAIIPFLGVAGNADTANAISREDQAYASSPYDYCDAKKVAAVWGISVSRAKSVIGRKILQGNQRLLNADIDSTARSVRCSIVDIGLSYRDAEKLAAYWGRTSSDAKAKAAAIASQYGGGKFRIMMAHVIGRR
ncbi:hypothetical protein [Jiella marina]|uniref:hypothetical protein n=1 Tax=Jiella sp. LLJ827 TaxID=2917712 RepID=UPI002100FA9E|nr:hypothetical protein [Jiella sp. LLJ827]MCQ0990198.1 hypothetical protein [Jiella sp. LLJ827]